MQKPFRVEQGPLVCPAQMLLLNKTSPIENPIFWKPNDDVVFCMPWAWTKGTEGIVADFKNGILCKNISGLILMTQATALLLIL
jgi:hypothetical protein